MNGQCVHTGPYATPPNAGFWCLRPASAPVAAPLHTPLKSCRLSGISAGGSHCQRARSRVTTCAQKGAPQATAFGLYCAGAMGGGSNARWWWLGRPRRAVQLGCNLPLRNDWSPAQLSTQEHAAHLKEEVVHPAALKHAVWVVQPSCMEGQSSSVRVRMQGLVHASPPAPARRRLRARCPCRSSRSAAACRALPP